MATTSLPLPTLHPPAGRASLILRCVRCALRFAGPTSETDWETCPHCGFRFCRCCQPGAVVHFRLPGSGWQPRPGPLPCPRCIGGIVDTDKGPRACLDCLGSGYADMVA